MASNIASAAMWAAVFTPTADEIAKEIVAEEARLRALEEKAYWEGWDKAFKEGTITKLRNEKNINLMTLNQKPIYPNLTQTMVADLLENGELRLICLNKLKARCAIWSDSTREEAQDAKYLKYLEKVKEALKDDPNHRII